MEATLASAIAAIFVRNIISKLGSEKLFVFLPPHAGHETSMLFTQMLYQCLQCFDTVGWASGSASGL